jgi:thrombospondin type 3 repeat protein
MFARTGAAGAAMGLGALLVTVTSCGKAVPPTSLFVTIEAEAAIDPPPDELRISVFGNTSAILQNQRLPASGPLVPSSPTSLGTVTIYLPDAAAGPPPQTTAHARLDVRALVAGAPKLEGALEVDVPRGTQVAATVTLRAGALPDGDGDGVPDVIDDCPATANPNQADADGNGLGDVCDAAPDERFDAGFDAGLDARFDAADDARPTEASADARPAEPRADGSASGGTGGGAGARTDAGRDVGATDDGSADRTHADAGRDAVMGSGGAGGAGPPPPGVLTITALAFRASVNLTTEGTIDWMHWGTASVASFDHKATGGGKISDLLQRGAFRYDTSLSTYSWSDGAPTVSDSTNSGVYDLSSSTGFSFTVPADTTARTLRLYAGGEGINSRLTAHLSDGSTPDAVLSTTGHQTSGAYVAPMEITFRAASAGRTLTLTWAPVATGGALSFASTISINGATLF